MERIINKIGLKGIGIIATLISLSATLMSDWVSDQKMDEKIEEKVNKALAEKRNEEES